jgi:hypothetical protein
MDPLASTRRGGRSVGWTASSVVAVPWRMAGRVAWAISQTVICPTCGVGDGLECADPQEPGDVLADPGGVGAADASSCLGLPG